jgi:undecaprenyl-diphosphatase
MFNARTRFWIAATLSGAVWLTMIFFGGEGSEIDLRYYRELYVGEQPAIKRNAIVFTQLGRGMVLVPIGLLAAAILAFVRKRRAALFLIMVFGGRFLVELQKLIFDRDRPGVSPHLEAVSTYAFPSSHAANSMITFLAIALLLPVRQRNRAIAVGLGLALSLQIGASRVMLGVHWPSDVIGGWAFGLLWVAICMRLANARPDAEPHPQER